MRLETKVNNRDVKIQGYSTGYIVAAMGQIEIAEGKKLSHVIHDACAIYVSTHPDVQNSIKTKIILQNFGDKLANLTLISSQIANSDEKLSNFVSICINLSKKTTPKIRKGEIIPDIKTLVSDLKRLDEHEYNAYIKIGHKFLNKVDFGLIFNNDDEL